jgi:FolB domain-containing protein
MRGDVIRLAAFDVGCLVGIFAAERATPQTVGVELEITLDLTAAALSGAVARTLDYGEVEREAAFLLAAARFRLLETAALALVAHLLAPGATAAPAVLAASAAVTKRRPAGMTAQPTVRMRRGAAAGGALEDFGVGALAPSVLAAAGARIVFAAADAAVGHAPAQGPLGALPGLDAREELVRADGSRLVVWRRPG